ncbi:MAG: efflux RND transporter periplasmic adaptor subunit [Marinilabiliales bacterium]|nr:efflux RND transporter periplasmic adaptor subunit [Marinilabiliales bacterium]
MKIHILSCITAMFFLSACAGSKEKTVNPQMVSEAEPLVKEDGRIVQFPEGSTRIALFKTFRIENKKMMLSLSAPANVVGRVHLSSGKPGGKIILFDTPDLTAIYSTYLQNMTLQKTARINFDRVTDLYQHGAATGKELNDASTELLNLETSLASGEAQLRELGLNPENLNKAPNGTVWLICDLPESEWNTVKKGQKYNLLFPSFPNEVFVANIDVIADVMNSQTRKIKVRLSLQDPGEKIRPGMYAQVNFEAPHEGLMVPRKAVFSTNARYYLFVGRDARTFERREVSISSETGDFIEIAGGVKEGEQVVSDNVYLLKGIDLGI